MSDLPRLRVRGSGWRADVVESAPSCIDALDARVYTTVYEVLLAIGPKGDKGDAAEAEQFYDYASIMVDVL